MKLLISAVCLLVLMSQALAGPFGLSMGMKKDQISGLESTNNPLIYKTTTVPTPSSLFDTYVLQIGGSVGLCVVKAVGAPFQTSRYGLTVKEKFNSLKAALAQKYGKHKTQDFLLPGSIWDEPEDFMAALAKNERYLRAYWDAEENSSLTDELKGIVLVAAGLGLEKAILYIQYEFNNSELCDKEAEAIEANAL